ncbi:unnamed protein product [Onchocerca ochengi]|uniref:FMRFamide-related neuropeptides n=2 Tax=Onchocerca TaxID=6281 RepID=A0A182E6C0_ONCOC|nr:unnamed protein product [Onchocerca ochengi]
MPTIVVLLMVTMMAIYSGVEVVESLQMYENDPEMNEGEIRTLCSLNPTLSFCSEHAMEKRKSSYMRFGRSYPVILDIEPYPFEKRKSAYMRFGKRSTDSNDFTKRKSAYMRFGR